MYREGFVKRQTIFLVLRISILFKQYESRTPKRFTRITVLNEIVRSVRKENAINETQLITIHCFATDIGKPCNTCVCRVPTTLASTSTYVGLSIYCRQ